MIGNPPYSGISSNVGEWIQNLVRRYYSIDGKSLGERNPKWLLDDYVKFVRFGEAAITTSGLGLVGFITDHGFIANPTFRGLRHSLLLTFGRIDVLDLHGNQNAEKSLRLGRSMRTYSIFNKAWRLRCCVESTTSLLTLEPVTQLCSIRSCGGPALTSIRLWLKVNSGQSSVAGLAAAGLLALQAAGRENLDRIRAVPESERFVLGKRRGYDHSERPPRD